jgi:hypothetical protein
MSWVSEPVILETARIGAGVRINAFSVIRSGGRIGDAVVFHPDVVTESGVTGGDKVEAFPVASIGKVPKRAGALARAPTFTARIEEIRADSSTGHTRWSKYDVVLGAPAFILQRRSAFLLSLTASIYLKGSNDA